MSETTPEPSILPKPIKGFSNPESFVAQNKELIVFTEFGIGIVTLLILLAITKGTHKWKLDAATATIMFSFSELVAFSSLFAAVIYPSPYIILPALLILLAFNGAVMFYSRRLPSPQFYARLIFALSTVAMFAFRVLVGLNFQNPKLVDMTKNLGNALSFLLGVFYNALDKLNLDFECLNCAGGLTDFAVTYSIMQKHILIKLSLTYDKKTYVTLAASPRCRTNRDSESLASKARTNFLNLREEILMRCENIMKQEDIDEYLFEVYAANRDNSCFTSMVTAMSTGVLKLAANYKKMTVVEYIQYRKKSFRNYNAIPELEMIVYQFRPSYQKYKSFAVVPQATTYENAIAIASSISINLCRGGSAQREMEAFRLITRVCREIRGTRGIETKVAVEAAENVRLKSFYNHLEEERQVMAIINPYATTSPEWQNMFENIEYVTQHEAPNLTNCSRMISLKSQITVTKFVNTAESVKSRDNVELIVAEDEFETSSSITGFLSYAVNADRLRVCLTSNHHSFALHQLLEC